MLKKAAALFLVCASMATWVGCGSTSSRYLYAAIPASNEIVAYREDPNSGVLTQLTGSPMSAGQAVQSIVIHPSKKFLYAANSGEGDVSLFTISSAGALTEITPRTTVGTAPTLLAMDSAGGFLYVGNAGSNNISVFSMASGTGALTPVGSPFPIGMTPLNMRLSPSGGVLYVTGQGQTTGFIEAFALVQGVPQTPGISGSPFATGRNPYGLVIAPGGGFLYTANTLDNSISEFTINATDGSLSPISGSPIGETYSGPVVLFIDKSGAYMYVANQGSTNLAAYSIGSDGTLALLTTSPFGTGAGPSSIAGDSGGKYLFVGNQSSPVIHSFSLDRSTGALTSVATYSVPGNPTSIAITP
jgi:6-phosphogluconolactonase (cycloisomerase 2 family)